MVNIDNTVVLQCKIFKLIGAINNSKHLNSKVKHYPGYGVLNVVYMTKAKNDHQHVIHIRTNQFFKNN